MSDTETTTNSLVKNEDRWWIKFNEETGKILGISNRPISEGKKYSVVESTSDLCNKAKGTSMRKYTVQWNSVDDVWEITEKATSLVLKNRDFSMHQITAKNPNYSDISITMYKKVGMIHIKLNIENIKKSMNLSTINEVSRTDDVFLNFYITDKYNPDKYIDTIAIEPLELFKIGSLYIDISESIAGIDPSNICFHTRKIFNTYSYRVSDTDIMSDSVSNNRPIQTATSSAGHIRIFHDGTELHVDSFVNENNEHVLSNYEYLKFLVCSDTIDNIVGVFDLKTTKLTNNKKITKLLDFEWPRNAIILYRNSNISVQYVTENKI